MLFEFYSYRQALTNNHDVNLIENNSFVELEKLKVIYHNLSRIENVTENDLTIDDMDPNEFLRVVDAYDMPCWNYSNEKKGFIR